MTARRRPSKDDDGFTRLSDVDDRYITAPRRSTRDENYASYAALAIAIGGLIVGLLLAGAADSHVAKAAWTIAGFGCFILVTVDDPVRGAVACTTYAALDVVRRRRAR